MWPSLTSLGWYDQEQDEWVLILEGEGRLIFADNRELTLKVGDFVHISAHTLHKVSHPYTDSRTVWLAIFFDET